MPAVMTQNFNIIATEKGSYLLVVSLTQFSPSSASQICLYTWYPLIIDWQVKHVAIFNSVIRDTPISIIIIIIHKI